MSDTNERREREIDPASIKAVRAGSGANCSSIGSVIDTLFASAVVGGAIFAAVAAALAREEVRVVGAPAKGSAAPPSADDEAGKEAAP